jgi:hypothetical protein
MSQAESSETSQLTRMMLFSLRFLMKSMATRPAVH